MTILATLSNTVKRLMPAVGRMITPDPMDRAADDVSRYISPAKVDQILRKANSGDAADQAQLTEEILEKNFAIFDAYDVRCKAVLGLKWHVEAGDDSKAAEDAASRYEAALRTAGSWEDCDTFRALLSDMLKSLLTGYSLNEIIWGSGGELQGFASISARNIDYTGGQKPRIRINGNTELLDLVPNKYVYAFSRLHGSDPVRGGLIRPLAWLHCFIQCNMRDMLAFIERYGMPFVLVKVDDNSFQNERNALLRMIRNFGSSGGGLVTKGTELVPVQAPNTTGDIYFHILEFFEHAVHRLLQGQTASSGDGGGLSKDNAQAQVRQDILEADAAYLADTINAQLTVPWMRFNAGPGVALPRLVFDCEPPADQKLQAEVIRTLHLAGFSFDSKEISDIFGLTLTPRKMYYDVDPAEMRQYSQRSPLSDLSPQAMSDTPEMPEGALERWLRPLQAHLQTVLDEKDPDLFKQRLHDLAYSREKIFGASDRYQDELEGAIWDSYCRGAATADRQIASMDKEVKK